MKAIIPALLLLCSCARVDYVQLSGKARPELGSDAPVNILLTKGPTCDYEEVGLMRIESHDLNSAFEALRKKARSIGIHDVLVMKTGDVAYTTTTATSNNNVNAQNVRTQTTLQTSTTVRPVVEAMAIECK